MLFLKINKKEILYKIKLKKQINPKLINKIFKILNKIKIIMRMLM